MKNKKPRKRTCTDCQSEFYTSYLDQEQCDECEALMIEEGEEEQTLCGKPHNNSEDENKCLECLAIKYDI